MTIALPSDIGSAAIAVLKTTDPVGKAAMARRVFEAWDEGLLDFCFKCSPPLRPCRPEKPELLPQYEMPKRRKAGTDTNKAALLHAVAHIELNAIDLAFDIVARFGESMPRAFTDDWLKVGDDEARHFILIETRLKELNSFYGAMPAHDGLWQSATATKDSLAARLAVVPMVLEARGLDVTPMMISRFERFGDQNSADILKIIYEEEVSHVAAGQKWFLAVAKEQSMEPEAYFQELVKRYFKGKLKRPFNEAARQKAGLFPTWYESLAD